MGDINVAIVGVGNCASSLVQGITKYADATANETIPGIMHPVLGEYGIGDIKRDDKMAWPLFVIESMG